MRIPSGVTDQVIYFVAVDSTDFTTRETGLTTFTVYRSRNGAAAAAMTTPTVTEVDATNMPGVYKLLLDEDMTIGAGNDSEEMVFHITQASMAPVTRTIELYRPKITAGYTLGVGADGDLLEVNTLTGHTAQTGDSYARLGAPAGASVSADIATIDSNVDAILVDTGTSLPADIAALNDPTAAAIADAVWDEAQSGHVGAGTFGEIATEIASILADTNELQTDDVPGLIAALNNISTAEVNAEVLDVLNTDTFAEPGQGAPAATTTLAAKINYLYKAWRNKSTQTATTYSLFDDAGTTVDQKATVSDDGTTATRGEIATGP